MHFGLHGHESFPPISPMSAQHNLLSPANKYEFHEISKTSKEINPVLKNKAAPCNSNVHDS